MVRDPSTALPPLQAKCGAVLRALLPDNHVGVALAADHGNAATAATRTSGVGRMLKVEARLRVAGPLTNTGTAPSCRSANAGRRLMPKFLSDIDLQQSVGHRISGSRTCIF